VLATGGTLKATRELVEKCGGVVVAAAVLMELAFLPGRETVGDLLVRALTTIGPDS
jgi:adenine phosphoribosyltransferase